MTLPDHTDILIVQDNQLEAELLLRPLREASSGLVIGVARDGEEALDYLLVRGPFRHRLGSPPPRLVVLDLKLPKLDAPDVVRAMRASHRTNAVPVVVLVPAAEPREVAQCYQAGANSCVRKPVEYREFFAVMQSVGRYWLGLNETLTGTPAVLPGGQ
jgi:two-component system response regulator